MTDDDLRTRDSVLDVLAVGILATLFAMGWLAFTRLQPVGPRGQLLFFGAGFVLFTLAGRRVIEITPLFVIEDRRDQQ